MTNRTERLLMEIMKKPGNNQCGECGAEMSPNEAMPTTSQQINDITEEQVTENPTVDDVATEGEEQLALDQHYMEKRMAVHEKKIAAMMEEQQQRKDLYDRQLELCQDPDHASYNIGIFLCARCANIHRNLTSVQVKSVSKVKHLKLDSWEDSQIERLNEVGNNAAKMKYEERVPICYRRPTYTDPQVLIEQWIRAKYVREEFCHPERQTYTNGHMEGFLMKRGKEDGRFYPRKFILNEIDDTLKYHVKERKDPKAVMRLSGLNVAFAPAKIGNTNSLQLTFIKDSTTRHIYVYHDDPEVIINWYTAIRCAKLHLLQMAFPTASENDLVHYLSRDFAKEGWLWKTGPRANDGYKKRWFTLDNRKLMYHDEPLDAYPKGEIYLGNYSNGGYAVSEGAPPGAREQPFAFTLKTPDRIFNLAAECESERDHWMRVIESVLKRPLTPQDNAVAPRLVRKRTTSNTISFSVR